MSRLMWMIMGIGMGVGLAYGASQYHVIRTTTGHEFIQRSETGFQDVYLDTRQFTAAEWRDHQELVQNILKSGKQQVLQQTMQQTLENTIAPVNPSSWK